MIPANGAASEATATPKQRGKATRNTTMDAEISDPALDMKLTKDFLDIISSSRETNQLLHF
jgi:hypothetical protein